MELESPEVQKQGWGVSKVGGLARVLLAGLFKIDTDENKESWGWGRPGTVVCVTVKRMQKQLSSDSGILFLCRKKNPFICVTGEEGEVWIKGFWPRLPPHESSAHHGRGGCKQRGAGPWKPHSF